MGPIGGGCSRMASTLLKDVKGVFLMSLSFYWFRGFFEEGAQEDGVEERREVVFTRNSVSGIRIRRG